MGGGHVRIVLNQKSSNSGASWKQVDQDWWEFCVVSTGGRLVCINHVDEGVCMKSRGEFASAGVQNMGKAGKGKKDIPTRRNGNGVYRKRIKRIKA